MRDRVFRNHCCAEHIYAIHPVPVFEGRVLDALGSELSSVVDQNIDAAERGNRRIGDRLSVNLPGDVGADGYCLCTYLFRHTRGAASSFLIEVSQHQQRTLFSETNGCCLPDARANPCYDCYLLLKAHSLQVLVTGVGAISRLGITRSIIPYSTPCSGLMM